MTLVGWIQAVVIFGCVCLLIKPLGTYLAHVFEGERVWLTPVLGPLERGLYRLCRIDPAREMSWKGYAFALLAFSLISFVYLYLLLRFQAFLPLNPQGFPGFTPDLAWNTAISFMTNTNWQFYSGESAMSYLSQMAGLAWHNFVSAATGLAVAIAVIRALARRSAATIGNFWVDLTRANLYVFLPLCLLGALVLCWQGVPQNFSAYPTATTLEGAKQSLPQGPHRFARDHQGAGHQRRRLPQRELGGAAREPDGLQQFPRTALDLRARRRADVYARKISARSAARLGALRGDGDAFRGRLPGGVRGGSRGESARTRPRRAGREFRRQGDALRHRRLRIVCGDDDRHVVRSRQRDARFVYGAGRARAADRHAVGRSRLRRRRFRTVRHDRLRRPHRLHRGPDGRAYAGVSGEEDRTPRSPIRDSRGARRSGVRAGPRGDRVGAARGNGDAG